MDDKIAHMIAGYGLYLFGLVISFNPEFGFGLAVAVGMLKELVWDWWWKKGTPDPIDMLATWHGGAQLYLVTLGVLWMI